MFLCKAEYKYYRLLFQCSTCLLPPAASDRYFCVATDLSERDTENLWSPETYRSLIDVQRSDLSL